MSQSERKVAFISAVTLLCSTLEFLIPKPLPFLRLGLANLPLLLILDFIDLPSFLAILLLKVIGQGMVSGTLFSYLILISLAGTLSSGLAMYAAKRLLKTHVSLVGVSLIGAFTSNLSQIAVAALVAYGSAIWIAAPLMLSLGLATSLVLGLFAERYRRRGTFTARFADPSFILELPAMTERTGQGVATIAVMVAIAAIIAAEGLGALGAIVLLSFAMQTACRRRVRLGPPAALLLSLLLLSLVEPNGRVLLSLGSIAITETALLNALTKALRLIALVSASQALVGTNPPLRGKAGSILVLTLAYFARLTHSFRHTQGSIIERVDQALERATGEDAAPTERAKPVHTPILLVLVTLIVATAAISRFLQ
ncbi:MAG TPA: Gx transporter family protein [Sphaerochaeta sp.]|nr:Gx transporter family protein [Sphaerochaeta sp.]